MTAAVRRLPGGEVGLWCPYEDRALAKRIPGARWDPDLRCWRIPAAFAADAEDVADLLNGTGPAAGDVEQAIGEATQRLLAAVPEDLRGSTWRALAHAWHPDHGGDDRAMRALLALKGAA